MTISSHRCILVFIVCILAALALFPAAALATADGAREMLYIITRTEKEAETLGSFAEAARIDYEVLLEEEYVSPPGEMVLTTLPRVAEDAKNAGIKPFCVGAEFSSEEDVLISEPLDTSVSLSFGEHSQTAAFVNGIRLLTYVNGTTEGTITLSDGRQAPFMVKCDGAWYAPWYEKNGLSAIAISVLIGQYCGTEGTGEMFVIIDEIYPFSDLSALKNTADMLYSAGVPFIARVMPVYNNLDYPAFERYADALRYVQSRNGTIVIHDFIEVLHEWEREPAADRMARFMEALDEQDVHYFPFPYSPLNIDIGTLEGISSKEKNFGLAGIDIMTPFLLDGDEAEREELLERINARWLTIRDYRLRYTTDKYAYESREVTENFQYIKEEERSFTRFFAAGNEVLVVVVVVALLVFGVLMVAGYRLYRRKFYR